MERLIDLYIGDQTRSYKIQKSLIASILEVFAGVINDDDNVTEYGVRFMEDDPEAWKVLLHWKVKGYLPGKQHKSPQEAHMWLSGIWILGEKYDIKDLQDRAMLEMFTFLIDDEVDLDLVTFVFENTLQGSKLAMVMAEEIAHLIRRGVYHPENLDVFEGFAGFTAAVVTALESFNKMDYEDSNISRHRLGRDEDGKRTDAWKKYMVGGGPKQHWIYE